VRRRVGRLVGRAGRLAAGGAVQAVLSLPHAAVVDSAAAGGRVGPGAAGPRRPAFLGHGSDLRGGGGRMARGRHGTAGVRAGHQRRGAFGGDAGRLPGRVLRGVLVVVEARLVRGRLRVAAAGGDAARRAQAAGVAVAVAVGQRQSHDGVDAPLGAVVLAVALFHLVLGVLAVGRDLDAGAFQSRGPVGSQPVGQVIARVVVLEAVARLVARRHRDDRAGLQGVVLGGQTGVAHSQRKGQADVWCVAVCIWKGKEVHRECTEVQYTLPFKSLGSLRNVFSFQRKALFFQSR